MNFSIGCVVVHHNNFPDVLGTLDSLAAAGVPVTSTVVVDNSEDFGLESRLRGQLRSGTRLIVQRNSGYAAAVNVGVRTLLSSTDELSYIVVSTHEVRVDPAALRIMTHAMSECDADVAGPTLFSGFPGTGSLWSTGGTLSRFFSIPKHSQSQEWRSVDAPSFVERAWLDGALCVYSARVFDSIRFDEDYFLYFEEVDFHVRVRAAGGRVIWVPRAHASQTTSGMPAYYLARNSVLFHATHGRGAQALLSPAYAVLRRLPPMVLGREPVQSLSALVAGLRDGRRLVRRRRADAVRGRATRSRNQAQSHSQRDD